MRLSILQVLALYFILAAALIAQPEKRSPEKNPGAAQGFHYEYHLFEDDSLLQFNFAFRINNNMLVFKKDNGNYRAEFTVELEVRNEDNDEVKRESTTKKTFTEDYHITRSEFHSVEGLMKLHLEPGEYLVEARVFDNNSERTGKIKPFELKTSEIQKEGYFSPIVIKTEKFSCNNKNYFELVNYRGAIPFASEQYAFLLPTEDLTKETLNISIAGFMDTISLSSGDFFISNIEFFECDDEILLRSAQGKAVKMFVFNGFSHLLREQQFEILLDSEGDRQTSFPMQVYWVLQPKSMRDPERAIKFLSFIEKEEVIDSLLDYESEKYRKVLYDYWQPKDPTPGTAFNELMAEYYKRIDYSNEAFQTLKGNDGEKTDRAEIYIQFGQPDDITRSVTKEGFVTEIWDYVKLQKKFIFVDNSGKGNFKLESTQ